MPYLIINNKGGIVIWKNEILENDIHTKIELRDVQDNYIYSYFKIYLPPEKYNMISDIIYEYDAVKKEIMVKSNNIENNLQNIASILKKLDNSDILNNSNIEKYIKEQLDLNHEKYRGKYYYLRILIM